MKGETKIHLAAINGHAEEVRKLLEDVSSQISTPGFEKKSPIREGEKMIGTWEGTVRSD